LTSETHDEAVIDEAVIDEAVIDEAVIDEAVIDEAVIDEAVIDKAVHGSTRLARARVTDRAGRGGVEPGVKEHPGWR